MTKIKDYFLVKNGFAFKSGDFVNSGIPLIKIQNITQSSIDLSLKNSDYLPPNYEVDYSNFLIKSNDILVALSGATLGKFAFFPYTQPALLNQRVALIRPLNDNTNIKYLYYYLFHVIESIKHKEKEGAQANISTNDIENTVIYIPSIESQNKIVATLDKISSLIDKRKITIRLLDEMVYSTFINMFGDPVRNTKKWKKEPISNFVLNIISGKSISGINRPMNADELGVLKISSVTYGEFKPEKHKAIDKNSVDIDMLIFPMKNDLLISRANTKDLVGATSIVDKDYSDVFLPDKIWKLKIDTNKITPLYFHTIFSNKNWRMFYTKDSTGSGGSMFNISQSTFNNIKIPLPKLNSQIIFNDKITRIKNYKIQLQNSLEILEIIFKSFIQTAFIEKGFQEISEVKKHLDDMFLQQDLMGKINSQDFQEYEEYHKAKKLLFELLESGKSHISQSYDNRKKKIKLQIL